jgi:tetratricopeptide (TPR) repeat protein
MKTRAFLVTLLLSVSICVPGIGRSQPKEQLGTVNFPNSCSAAAQEGFQRGVAMLHSFRYGEAEKTFREVLAQDPSCAVATWGIAAVLMSNPLTGFGPSKEWAERAQAAIDQGRKIGAKTQRERDYIEAVAAYYDDWSNRPERTRQLNRASAFQALAARYPADDEAQIFYALYLAATQSLADQTYATYLTAAAILEKEFAKYPDHPGVAHYLIHSYDAAPIAPKGVPAARRYASIAPAAPHALHMPSHIFTRVGAWSDSAATNERAAMVAKRDKDVDEQLHSMDYMVYAYLQLARDDAARRVIDESAQASGLSFTRFVGPYALSAMPARYAIERGDWRQAAKLEPAASSYPFAMALTHFARGLGAARSGDPAAAEKEGQELARLRDALKAAKNEYWAGEVEVSRLGVAAWAALAQGKRDEALSLMRSAADAEDKSEKHIVTPGRILPARELLGEMLLELKRPAEALKEFEASQVREPERFRGYYGAGQAAAQSGDKTKAKRSFTKLVEMAGQGAPRPEIVQARAFLSANP